MKQTVCIATVQIAYVGMWYCNVITYVKKTIICGVVINFVEITLINRPILTSKLGPCTWK